MGEMVLFLGGARSGKSRLAEALATSLGSVVSVASAMNNPSDPEMTTRIHWHRIRRPADWATIEAPRDLELELTRLVNLAGSVVIDCVTLWITNLMLGLGGGPACDDGAILDAVDRAALASRGQARTICVSNEVGAGIVPANSMARRFADLQGWANQRFAEAADVVRLCVAGLTVRLK